MKDRFLVKFVDKHGKTVYGTYQQYETKKLNKKGIAFINDAILPTYHEVAEKDLVDIKMTFRPQDEYHAYVEAELNKAMQHSDNQPDGVVVGKLLSFGVADGYAWYIITKVNKKTCKVEWRGFSSDSYFDRWLGYGKTVPIEDIAPYCKSNLFARRIPPLTDKAKEA